uniref:J domain-containing protein n=1 Tax=Kalanchoe fedtschenkoi TaxID=63787 RepID=A0A7N0ZUR9_KALFE
MKQSDFRFSGANEFNPNLSFTTSTASRSDYGRTKPRLTKLRKPKSSQGAADSAYNPFRNNVYAGGRENPTSVFGWRSAEGLVAGGKGSVATDGSSNGNLNGDNLRVPNFSVASSDDKNFAKQLPNEFRKLNVRENSTSGSGEGVAYTSGNSSYFEFGSSKNGDSHGTDNGRSSVGVLPDELRKLNLGYSARDTQWKQNSDNFVFGTVKSSFSGLNGSTEAMLSKKMEDVCIGGRGGDLNSGTAWGSSSHENFQNGTYHESKENKFFREADTSVPTPFNIPTTAPSNHANGGSHLSSSSAPSSSLPATSHCYHHETNSFLETFGNGHIGEKFFFSGKFDPAFTSDVKSGINRKDKSVPKRHPGKESNLKKKRENVKNNWEARVYPASFGHESVSKEFISQPESPQTYSPMDMSPYPEVMVDNQNSNEAPMTSEESFTQNGKFQSSETNNQDGNHPIAEDLIHATQQLNISEVSRDVSGTNTDYTKGFVSENIGEIPTEESVSGTETESFKSATEDLELNTDNTPSAATKTSLSPKSGSERTTNFYSICNSEGIAGSKFTFTASTSSQGPALVRPSKTKNRKKGFDSYRSTATSKVSNAFSSCQDSGDSLQCNNKADLAGSQLKLETNASTNVIKEVNHESGGTSAATAASQEACEKWRLRGNQAYANEDLSKAEEYYTRGVKCISASEKSRGCLRALMLCYSNRAATRMSMGRLREAVEDCKLAAGIDPNFLRAHVRAANCYLALGEVEEASKYFKYCLQPGISICADRKILIEASEGLKKAQKVAECMSRSFESSQRGTCNDAEDALRSADEALTISLYSEKLLEIKAEALFMLQKYNKVIQLCQGSLDSAERNSNIAGVTDPIENPNNGLLLGRIYFRLWRCRLMVKSYFFLGKLEEALTLLENNESLRKGNETLESLIPFVAAIRELLRYKAAGNEAFQSGKYQVAIEHYTAALSFNVDSRPFAAICFCNRAAAYKAQGKIIDAIADCNLAIALERDYLKAISRRASLYESIRDYGQAVTDAERIVSLMKEQADFKHKTELHEKSTTSGIPIDLRQAQLQLSRLEEQARKDIPLNMYLILGIESSVSASEIKKAYRQAALKHHPDKAGQILAKGDGGRNGSWKEIAEDIHRDADRLFKLIGEAYTVLSDPAQVSFIK